MSPPAEDRWEGFAAEDAELYIWTPPRTKPGEVDLARFFETGREEADEIMRHLSRHLTGHERAAEIGAGVGRLAIPMAMHFAELMAVDVSPTMLEKLRSNCLARGVGNVRTSLLSGPWDAGPQADLVYSWAVFQHIEDAAKINTILERIRRLLRPGTGIAYLHFDTRPLTPMYHLKTALPDPLLPRMRRRGIRRIRRRAADVRSTLRRLGYEIVEELQPDGEGHVFLARGT